jgi:hypothetical protein
LELNNNYMNNLKKEFPINGYEEDLVQARKIYCYLRNNSKNVKFLKKKMNKRFRLFNKNINNFI